MFCPPDSNTGFIELVGPIQPSNLEAITVKKSPLSISFKPRTTIPSILGNKIDESTGIENTCTYGLQRFNLADVQICNVINKGFILPDMKGREPAAELVLTFSANNTATNSNSLSGILLCIKIYNNGTPDHNKYLDLIINSNNNNVDNNNPTIPNLESIFYGWKGDTTQTSIAYTTCFETINQCSTTINQTISSKSLYVIVFPRGITLESRIFETLRSKLLPYSIPASIRNGDKTIVDYRFDNKGNKDPNTIVCSDNGSIYSSQIKVCDSDFKHRFEYFTLPPRTSSSSNKWNSEQCPYYQTSQYKCVPFNQSKDLSGEYIVPGSKTLETIINERKDAQNNATTTDNSLKTLTTDDIEGIVAGVVGIAIVTIIILKAGDWISKQA